jgi:hypothetical protein
MDAEEAQRQGADVWNMGQFGFKAMSKPAWFANIEFVCMAVMHFVR